jgi:glyoxylase-like metal-dependent hydrolase (beta-lactamase superfamily II)/rhodanese-related sulfurtransferase
MFLKQYYIGCLAHASYTVGDEQAGVAAVIDPRRDVDEYVADAEAAGMRIGHVILTHFHADFVSSHLEFRDRFGAEIHVGARGEAQYAFTPAHDGDILALGAVRLEFLETPGHTPEGICAVVYDGAADPAKAHAVFTGDTLFIGDVGRPDLVVSQGFTSDVLAGWLYDSLREKLLPLPDDTLVYPAHGAGSLCGRNLSSDTYSTMGVQRLYNYALQEMTKEAFIEVITADLPTVPAYFGWDANLNKMDHPFPRRTVDVARLGLGDFLALMRQGAQVLDAREARDFAAAHLRGSINIGLDGSFAQWAGAVLDFERPILLVVYPGGEPEAVMRLARVGLDDVPGFLSGGTQSLEAMPELVDVTERITAATLAEQLESDDPPLVVDVRAKTEWEAGHIDGSINIPLPELAQRLDELPSDRRLALHCLSAYRSSIAAGLLQRAGRSDFTELIGGIAAWEASSLPVVV